MNKYSRNMRIRLILICLVAVTVVITAIHLATYMTTRAEIENRLIISARGVASAMAYHITQDIEDYKAFSETRDTDSEYYRKMQDYFMMVKRNGNITYIYTERRLDEHTVEFILDAEVIGSENYSPPGSLDTNEPRKEQIYQTGKPDSYRFSEGSLWGDLVVSYAPILDRDGSVIGLLGADIDIQEAYSQLGRMQGVLITTYVILLLLVAVILFRYSNVFLDSLLKDKLTGAYSKRYLEKFLKDEIKQARKDKRGEIACMMLDLDHFKSVNDTYGHPFGDAVLKTVSKAVHETIRSEDYFIRYGGEEFVIIIARASAAQALEIANRIRAKIEGISLYNDEHAKEIPITVSIGVGSMSPHSENVHELVNLSDKALYMAKKDRNKVVWVDERGEGTV